MAIVDRFRAALERSSATPPSQEYAPLNPDQESLSRRDHDEEDPDPDHGLVPPTPFSKFEYIVFLFLGIAMLWAWNMFLAASPYFARRFASSQWISKNYQSSITSVGTLTNLASMLTLANLQAKISYTRQLTLALSTNVVAFTLLAISTIYFKDFSDMLYLVWVLASVFVTSVATSFLQSGAFALAVGSGHPGYTQAIMTGQGIAGVLPPLAQILTVLLVPASKEVLSEKPTEPEDNSSSAFVYFLTATVISGITLFLVLPLIRSHNVRTASKRANVTPNLGPTDASAKARVPLSTLFSKLRYLASAVFICFTITMFFPVFTARIQSVQDPDTRSRIFATATFIPLAFFCWNAGDLLGRLTSPFLPKLISERPQFLLFASVSRVLFIWLYYLCNFDGRGGLGRGQGVWGDVFYLLVVQVGFGLTNGWVGSLCMMGSPKWVDKGQEEPAGGFMSLMLVGGLAVGSTLSFAIR